ncbi:hypothetical protein C8R44DRAFT_257751 [Mycena epipterygia]|nr:hypothetical protein C8R44DRAFT_257751 [Mycena epipterygia]
MVSWFLWEAPHVGSGHLAPTSKLSKEFGPRAKSRQFCMQTRPPDEGVLRDCSRTRMTRFYLTLLAQEKVKKSDQGVPISSARSQVRRKAVPVVACQESLSTYLPRGQHSSISHQSHERRTDLESYVEGTHACDRAEMGEDALEKRTFVSSGPMSSAIFPAECRSRHAFHSHIPYILAPSSRVLHAHTSGDIPGFRPVFFLLVPE